jgi:hypothetical protein
MNAQTTRFWIEIIAALTIPIAIGAVMYQRYQGGGGGAISLRTLQVLAIAVLTPLILILGLERVLEPSAVGALIGALLGYLLSGIGNDKA